MSKMYPSFLNERQSGEHMIIRRDHARTVESVSRVMTLFHASDNDEGFLPGCY